MHLLQALHTQISSRCEGHCETTNESVNDQTNHRSGEYIYSRTTHSKSTYSLLPTTTIDETIWAYIFDPKLVFHQHCTSRQLPTPIRLYHTKHQAPTASTNCQHDSYNNHNPTPLRSPLKHHRHPDLHPHPRPRCHPPGHT